MKKEEIPKIRFTWLIHYRCNYRCSYCFYSQGCGWEILKDKNIYLSVDTWIKYWKRIYDKYGRCAIIITGGEPFIYPDFFELINRLSQIHYPINISSNASINIELFAKMIDPEKVSLSLSFHPEFEDINRFIDKLTILRKHNFDGCINFVAYPPFIKNINFYKEKLNTIGERLKIIPFRGIYKDLAYPWSYTQEDLLLMEIKNDWFERIKKKNNLCIAGKNTALLLPDGTVVRCGQVFYRAIIGNFFDENFKLLEDSLPCEVEICPCDEDIIWGELN
jgi:MoaA/NifB/PqqE/SkfB family radical SAM enzyme